MSIPVAAPPADDVRKLEIFVLGDRNFPLSPLVKVEAEGIERLLGPLVAEARRRLPDTTYGDVLKLALRIGLAQLPRIFEAEGRVERGGFVSFTPQGVTGKAKGGALAAQRLALSEHGVLSGAVVVGEREAFTPPGPQGPKDTIPQPGPSDGDPARHA